MSGTGAFGGLGAYARLVIEAGGWRVPAALALSVSTGLIEGVGFLFLIPLLALVGVDHGGGATDAIATRLSGVMASVGLPLTLPVVLTFFVAIMVAQGLILMMQSLINLTLESRISTRLRDDLYDAILHADWHFLTRQRGSDLAHAMTSEIDRTGPLTLQLLATVATTTQIVVALAVAARIAPVATAVVSAIGVMAALALRSSAARSERLGREYAAESGHAYGLLSDGLAALRTIKSIGAERQSAGALEASHRRLVTLWHQSVANYVQTKFAIDATAVVVLAVLVYVALTVLRLPAAALLVLLYIFARTVPRVSALQHSLHLFVHALPAFAGIVDLLGRCRAAEEPRGPAGDVALERAIRLENVTFEYEPGRRALDGLSLEVPARGLTALVGPSGAGKTTAVDVLMGLLRPTSGAVHLDAVPLAPESTRAWRDKVAYVSQDPFLFHDTIRANLLKARPSATAGEIDTALTQSGAAEFVSRLPDGLETVVGDRGGRLSGGERQRIAIARALLRRPALLVLDEPTSALDPASERHVLETLARLAESTAVVMVTHRLASVREADRIYVLEQGHVVEAGTWADLTGDSTRFRLLSQLQNVAP
jgi:ATP-binding cassette subfamily C protein